jgi:hypothetical protein
VKLIRRIIAAIREELAYVREKERRHGSECVDIDD